MARTFKPKLTTGHRSTLEQRIASDLDGKDIAYGYESLKIRYKVPERESTYTPDFNLANGIIVEVKGWPFEAKDRQKHLLIKEQRPDLDIRFVFANASNKIAPGSLTTWADWCRQHGFQFAEKTIPDEWLEGCADTSRYREALGRLIPTKTKKSSLAKAGSSSTTKTSRSKKPAS